MEVIVKLTSYMEFNLALHAIEDDDVFRFICMRKGIGSRHLQQLASVIKRNKTLRELWLADNVMENQGAKYLADAMMLQRDLYYLDIKNNSIKAEGMQALAQSFILNESLNMVDISKNPFEEAGAIAIATVLKVHSSLVELRLDSAGIKAEGAKHISEALKMNKVLTVISLRKNNIGNEGASEIGTALRHNTSLTHIFLTNNSIDDVGVKHLGKALLHNKSLLWLDLNSNLVGEAGAKCLGNALCVNTSLFSLSVARNRIGDAGCEHLAKGLKGNTALNSLHISTNSITNVGAEHMADLMDKNSTLTSLTLITMNRIDDLSVLDRISSKLKENEKNKKEFFFETLNSDAKAAWSRSRLMFVGQGRAGKSATVRSLLGQSFNPDWDSTIGADVSESQAASYQSSWKEQQTEEDLSAQFAARIMTTNSREPTKSKSSSKVAIISKGSTEDDMAAGILSIPEDLCEYSEAGMKLKGIQEEDEDVDDLNHEEAVKNLGKMLLSAKAGKDALSLSLWDFGGQTVFYSMHHLFLTKSGVYVLVFDMREILAEETKAEAMQYILFWLRSVRLHAPMTPLLMVGTFLDDCNGRGDIQIVDDFLKRLSRSSFPQIVQNTAESISFFPIDNMSSKGILVLRHTIENVVRNDEMVSQQVSIRWVGMLDSLLSKRKSGQSYITLSGAKKHAKRFGIRNISEIEEALSLFHDRGMIIHLTSTEVLKNIIVIQPQWLIQAMSKIIRDGNLHAYDESQIKQAGLEEDYRRTFDQALASRDFFEYVWNNEQVDFLLDLMQRTMLLSEWDFNNEKYYLVPSLLKTNHQCKMTGHLCIFDFSESFLPTGVFQRLICLSVGHSTKYTRDRSGNPSLKQPELYQSYASIEFEPGLILNIQEDIELQRIVVFVADTHYAAKIYTIINSMLRKLNHDVMGTGLVWNTLLEDSSTGQLIELVKARNEKLAPWFNRKIEEEASKLKAENVDLASFLSGL